MLTDDRIDDLLDESKPAIDATALLRAFSSSEPKHGHRRLTRRVQGGEGRRLRFIYARAASIPMTSR